MEWAEAEQKKKLINVPSDVYEQGCIPDVEAGLEVGTPSPREMDSWGRCSTPSRKVLGSDPDVRGLPVGVLEQDAL